MRLSENIESIFAEDGGKQATLKTVLDRVGLKSFGILLAVLSLPSALPLPAPGYSVPGGLALIFLGVQMLKRREYPWFPENILAREIHINKKPRLIRGMVLFLRIFEMFVRPRLTFMFSNGIMYRFLGLMVFLCGVSMSIPVPLTNTAPAFGVFLIGLGMLEEDGLFSCAGILAGIMALCLSTAVLAAILIFGMEGVDLLRGYIRESFSMID